MRLVATLARLWPADVTVSEQFSRSIRFLGWATDPPTLVRAGYGFGILLGIGTALALLVGPLFPGPVGWLLPVVAGFCGVHAVHETPTLLATTRRTAALGEAPTLIALAALRMRMSASPERAAAFAAEQAEGPLATSLRAHVDAAVGSGRSGLTDFGDDWRPWFPSLSRAMGLVDAAGRVPAGERDRVLDRALETVLEGTRSRMQDYAGSIHGPTTALYAFGVLLPTALVSLVPAARAAGLAVTLPVVVLVYDLLLPAGLVAASAWLLARRPIAFPPPRIDTTHPHVTDRRLSALVAGVLAGLVTALAVGHLLAGWLAPVAAAGTAPGVYLVLRYRPYGSLRVRIREAETGLPTALAVVGRRVARGMPVERAVEEAAADLDGEIGTVLETGIRRQDRITAGIEGALLGDTGPLQTHPSPRLRSGLVLLTIAAREGRSVGPAIQSMADHLDDLRRVERDALADLDRVVGTLRSTGAVFGPLVGGATVALAAYMGNGSLAGGAPIDVSGLGAAIGGYVLALAVILTALSVGLERGLDRHLVGLRVGTSLIAATACFLAGYAVAAAVT
jgi:Flp pilus assembly protein TadB